MIRATAVERRIRANGHEYFIGELRGQSVVLSLSGVGIGRARRATEHAIGAFPLSAIVFVGIAGGLDPELGVGDVVVPAMWGQHDTEGEPAWAPTNARLGTLVPRTLDLERCDRAPPCALAPRVRLGGRGVSGVRFIADPDDGRRLWDSYSARVVDMETSAVAEVSAARDLPFIAFRAISDVVATGNSHRDVDELGPVAMSNAARAALQFLEQLPVVSRS
jgi:adenosylhomocysteine nucleosidase